MPILLNAPWVESQNALNQKAKQYDSAMTLHVKEESQLCLALAWLFGLFGQRDQFLYNFATTICARCYISRRWSGDAVLRILPHEGRHVTQCRWCGLGLSPWLGLPLYSFLYLFFPFPVKLAWCRFWFELDADREVWRVRLRFGARATDIINRAERFGTTVCSKMYGWAWPISWGRRTFLRKAVETINEEAIEK